MFPSGNFQLDFNSNFRLEFNFNLQFQLHSLILGAGDALRLSCGHKEIVIMKIDWPTHLYVNSHASFSSSPFEKETHMRPQGFDPKIAHQHSIRRRCSVVAPALSTLSLSLLLPSSTLSPRQGLILGLRPSNPWDDFVYVLFNRLTDFTSVAHKLLNTKTNRTNLETVPDPAGSNYQPKPKRVWELAWAWQFVEHTRIAARTSRSFRLLPPASACCLSFCLSCLLCCLPFNNLN